MKVLNIGSMNLDHVYTVDHIVAPGETQSSTGLQLFLGGKGMNQSVALAKAGVEVYQGGMIGADGAVFLDTCREYGIHADHIRTVDAPTGHTIIQIDKNAQNCILLYGGANQMLTEDYVDAVISRFDAGDILLLQNEVNLLPYIVERGYAQGMQIVLNPSPFDDKLQAVDMGKISLFLLNEIEGWQLTGCREPDDILAGIRQKYPNAAVVLTLGADGAVYADRDRRQFQPIFPVQAVDTTAAGDTFTGYFLAGLTKGMDIADILRISAKASSIAVSRPGAVPSIPHWEEVIQSLSTT